MEILNNINSAWPEPIEERAECLNNVIGMVGPIVYDDVEAAWNQYSFSKVLTPLTAGEPTERQRSLTQKLAYVSFSRAMKDLRVLMFTSAPEAARRATRARSAGPRRGRRCP